jgi:hypothetical protein
MFDEDHLLPLSALQHLLEERRRAPPGRRPCIEAYRPTPDYCSFALSGWSSPSIVGINSDTVG